MFLILSDLEKSTINIGDVTNEILIAFIIAIGTFAFFGIKNRQKKRGIANYDFHFKLKTNLPDFRKKLDKNERLYIPSDINSVSTDVGNIFTLLYNQSLRSTYCGQYYPIEKDEFINYKISAEDLKKIITESDNSIFPRNSDKGLWESSIAVLLAFCNFITQIESIDSYNGETNELLNENGVPKHVAKCQELVNAMDYIINVLP